MKHYVSLTILAGFLSALIVACVAPGPVVAPPPPRTEVLSLKPGPNYVWIAGYWKWTGTDYAWISGHWMRVPPGKVWVPGHWEQRGARWVWKPGHWRRG